MKDANRILQTEEKEDTPKMPRSSGSGKERTISGQLFKRDLRWKKNTKAIKNTCILIKCLNINILVPQMKRKMLTEWIRKLFLSLC